MFPFIFLLFSFQKEVMNKMQQTSMKNPGSIVQKPLKKYTYEYFRRKWLLGSLTPSVSGVEGEVFFNG